MPEAGLTAIVSSRGQARSHYGRHLLRFEFTACKRTGPHPGLRAARTSKHTQAHSTCRQQAHTTHLHAHTTHPGVFQEARHAVADVCHVHAWDVEHKISGALKGKVQVAAPAVCNKQAGQLQLWTRVSYYDSASGAHAA